MIGVITAIPLISLLFLVIFILAVLYHYFELKPWLDAFFNSTREEKMELTRYKGHYNANGYLIHSDSDIQLDTTGSFKRFDSVDRDLRVTWASSSLTPANVDWGPAAPKSEEVGIPPQPLRPAPMPIPPPPPPREIHRTPPGREAWKAPWNEQEIPREPWREMRAPRRGPPSLPSRPENGIETITFEDLTTGIARLQYQYSTNPFLPAPESFTGDTIASRTFNSFNPEPMLREPPPTPPAVTQSVPGTPEPEDIPPISVLKRAVSCDSVCSDTSVNLENLEESNTTGYLCIGLEYDSECCDLAVSVLEAKDLKSPLKTDTCLDTYIRVFFLPDKTTSMQTRVYRNSNSPSYKERFLFALGPKEAAQRSLAFHVYSTDKQSHALVGEAEIRLGEMSLRQPVTTWVTLTDTGQKGTEFGEVLFSLSYLPTAERLTVVIVKARNLRFPNEKDYADTFIKVYLLQHGKKVHKKKTSTKKGERSPIFNEAMIFSVPAHTLQTIQLRVTVAESSNTESGLRCPPIGHIIVSSQASGRSLSHWNQMLSALRKPVAMWHPLRK